MKNASIYEKKVKKLLSSLGKHPAVKPIGGDPISVLIQSMLAADATHKQVAAAMATLEREFVDHNELRVSPPKEIVERLKDFPGTREKAEMVVKVLNAVFDKTGTMTMTYMDKMTKRDLRKHLGEIGMTPFAAAFLMLNVFDAHGMPVDRSLMYVLEAQECIEPGSDIEDVQGFLERVIPQKDALGIHELFRRLVEKNSKMIAKRMLADRPAVVEPAPQREEIAEELPGAVSAPKTPAHPAKATKPAKAVETDKAAKVKPSPRPAAVTAAPTKSKPAPARKADKKASKGK